MAGDEAAVAPRKGGTGTPAAQAPAPAAAGEAQAGLRCPRCDSPNTKFCYYNNYSLSQPRHFCKTCRRYWTKGGALRNVPVGGGCRKNKRSRSSASSAAAASSRLSLNLPGPDQQHQQQQADQQQAAAVRMGGGFHGVVDFHPGISMLPAGPGGLQLHSSSPTSAVVSHGQYVPFGEWPAPGDVTNNSNNVSHGMSGGGGGSIASSIESLSYINQDLHWKLQQQRVATMFLGPPIAADAQAHHHHHQFGAGAAFLQMETTTAVPAAATSWFMDSSSSYAPAPLQPNSSSSPCRPPAAAAAASCSNINSGRSSGGGGGGDVDNATSNNNNCGGSDNIPSWGDISTFAMLP